MALPVHTADFNPRSHEGSDNIVDNVDRAVNISIHAPTRGATISVQIVILQFKISIHAPTRGATTHADPPTACHDFNPRSHEGSDLAATCYSPPLRLFQSTLPRGERLAVVFSLIEPVKFQSTLPRGERQMITQNHTLCNEFQSTLPRGERRLVTKSQRQLVTFQSTLPRGERH